jgi:hypothetical protein
MLSLHQNGLSIGLSAVFGTYGPAKRADTGLNIRYFSAPKIQPDLRIEENERPSDAVARLILAEQLRR